MRVVPWDGPDEHAGDEPVEAEGPLNAMRSWLVSGIHLFVVDPRRRFGKHGRARELLVVERPARQEASERWQPLASALQRHAVRDGLASLSAKERRVITLAYLEGRTNREIAAMLGVSVSTVRRRLWVALEHLDIFLRRSGAWLAALVLAALAYTSGRLVRTGRWAGNPALSDRAHLVAATLVVGALGAAAAGFALAPGAPGATAHTAVKPPTVSIPGPKLSIPTGPLAMAGSLAPHAVAAGAGSDGSHSTNGCHGNPTGAPPGTPAGPRGPDPDGSPVAPPGVGGCKG